MDEIKLFDFLETQELEVLLDLLRDAYNEMDTTQRRIVFGGLIKKVPPSSVEADDLLEEIEDFYRESLSGYYYAPFSINSKNFSHIPEETEEWFELLGDLLEKSMLLTKQEEHSSAVKCFKILCKLIERMGDGEEIIFAEEYGDWMIPGDHKAFTKAYLTSLAATTNASEFTEVALPLIKDDSFSSGANKVYASAIAVANKEQKELLKKEVQARKIKTKI